MEDKLFSTIDDSDLNAFIRDIEKYENDLKILKKYVLNHTNNINKFNKNENNITNLLLYCLYFY